MIEYTSVMYGIPQSITIFGVTLYVYGLMYLLGALAAYWVTSRLVAPVRGLGLTREQLMDIVFYVLLGGVIGGRLVFALVYAPEGFWDDPLNVFKVWQGGMSIHGGLLGGAIALLIYARVKQLSALAIADSFAAGVALALAFGRFGNLANGELPGRETDSWLGVTYPDGSVRHLWPLYAIIKDLILFMILLVISRRVLILGVPSACLLIGMGIARFVAEFWREYDPVTGVVGFGWMSMGQALSMLLVVVGLVLLRRSLVRQYSVGVDGE